MPDQNPEATRLAEQRTADIAERTAAFARRDEADRQREREQGRRQGLDEAHTLEQDRHLAAINGSIEGSRQLLASLDGRLKAIETSFGEFVAVARAMGERNVSTRTFILGVIAVIVPIVVLFLSAGKA